MGSFLKYILDQAFPPNDVLVCFCCKSALVSELPFQVTALVCKAGHLFPRNPGCSQCGCDFTRAAVACVRADWKLAPEAIAGAGTWLRDHHSGVCTHDLVPLGRVKMSLA